MTEQQRIESEARIAEEKRLQEQKEQEEKEKAELAKAEAEFEKTSPFRKFLKSARGAKPEKLKEPERFFESVTDEEVEELRAAGYTVGRSVEGNIAHIVVS